MAEPAVLRVGEVELDTAPLEAWVTGRSVTLTAKKFAFLEPLAREPGRVFAGNRSWGASSDSTGTRRNGPSTHM
ncbi:hypothetical protein AB0G67_34900 [Streptomyces sp. NPDC021056]|uniref:hypothetical protein n=1 Tax=Streptomyces sp. NPDC021056 TaxID=3155012 RepID=UPI0033D8057E